MLLRMKKKIGIPPLIFYLGGMRKSRAEKIQTNLVSKYRYILNFYVTTFYAGFSHSYKLKEWDFLK